LRRLLTEARVFLYTLFIAGSPANGTETFLYAAFSGRLFGMSFPKSPFQGRFFASPPVIPKQISYQANTDYQATTKETEAFHG